jgi:hypothetical protein
MDCKTVAVSSHIGTYKGSNTMSLCHTKEAEHFACAMVSVGVGAILFYAVKGAGKQATQGIPELGQVVGGGTASAGAGLLCESTLPPPPTPTVIISPA